ncbi:hypothetical protein PRZ48_012383 [Zasmidium cellare]|uniref:NACHT domain-containing protein n=1 Tax=Zasmidium cellare TaxID=395010 RepID=A0ABR0E564_ZASCE|nr:hypothetical protein PRZ48_012383 [Zasmidium cellare]
MRLLERLSSQEIRLVGPFAHEDIPKYAILSHRWESDPQQEVSYEDMIRGCGRDKSGYSKIQFCAERAFQDNLKYFWVDTCCINKSFSGEHQKAINSMFRWYQRAERCYVYLADVFADDQTTPERVEHAWDTSIANSQWFERGWTLQELVAPRSVEFFSRDRVRLGNKTSLQDLLCRITGICSEALQGQLLTRFSANERFSWMERRKTTLEEDKVYALLGIFDVEVPITYGQGWSVARKLLDDAIAAQDQIIRSLRVTNPCYDKRRIEDTKGGLLPDVYHWVLENDDFKQWRHGDSHKVLWIRGDPGRGKTMLMCGIIDELEKIVPKQDLLAYFFCQTSDSRLNNATAVLRGLLYMLVDQQPSLVSHMERQYRRAGRDLFEDTNSWTALTEIFSNILQDDRLMSTIFAVDGLDECIEELPKLLQFVVRNSSSSHRIKWLVSSRHWPSIEQPFNKIEQMLALRLELNRESVFEAIHFYIHHKVNQLALERNYDKELEQQVRQHFLSNADETFLWVALVYQSLCTVHQRYVRSKLDKFPPGLDSVYKRMMDQIDENPDSADECHRALAIALIVSRPVTLKELGSFLTTQSNVAADDHWLAELVQLCGFLTIRTGTVFFVHQSAKDYLLAKAGHIIFPAGLIQEHDRLALLCIRRLSSPGVLSDDLFDSIPT